jgi:hypothetical protein
MIQDDQELARLRAAFATPAGPAPAPETCPAAETIWAAVRGELPANQIREVVEHTALCPACAEDWRLGVEVDRQTSTAATAKLAPVVRGRFRRWQPIAAAAALAACLAAVIGLQSDDVRLPGREPVYREAEGTAIRSLLPGETLARREAVLRWSPLPGASSYAVLVSTEDLRVVAEAEGLAAAQFQVPASALAGRPAGTRLFWRVDAVLADGSRRSSPTFTATLR